MCDKRIFYRLKCLCMNFIQEEKKNKRRRNKLDFVRMNLQVISIVKKRINFEFCLFAHVSISLKIRKYAFLSIVFVC